MSNIKKVAYYTNMPSPYRVDFFNELGKYCELFVFFEMDKSSTRNDKWQSYNFNNFTAIFLKGKSYSGEAAFCPSIIKEYKKIKPDINVVCNFSSLTGIKLVNYFIKHKIAYCIEGDGAFNRKDKSFIKKCIKNYCFSHAEKLFYTSDEHLSYLLSHKANHNKTIKYPFSSIFEQEICSIEDVYKNKNILKKQLSLKQSFTIITVGRFIKLKNIDLLLNAFKKYDNNCQLIIIGGKPTKEYSQIIDSLKLKNVVFIDFLSKEQLFLYYKAADLFVFTSLSDVWGLVVNEAMANGLPVISSKGALGSVEMSKNNNGIMLYNPGSLTELTSCIDIVIGYTKDQLLSMSKSNIKTIYNYTIETMCEKHKEVFKL